MSNVAKWLLMVAGMLSLGATHAQQRCDFAVSGKVWDIETKRPIPYAVVQIENTAIGAVTDEDGQFSMDKLCSQEFDLIVSCIGYKSFHHHHDAYHPNPQIYLAPDDHMLESVVVEGEAERSPLRTLEATQLSRKELVTSRSETLGDLAQNLVGVSTLTTGQNVVKPMIHGLHSNRILIINNGVRHAFQNWGPEHAPEIDASSAESLEVIKGAATVRYGPDALGGVLLVNSAPLELHSGLKGHVDMTGNTNGRSGAINGALQRGWEHWVVAMQGSGIKQGDLHAPHYQLTNTGKEEYGYSGGVRYHTGKLDLDAYYSHFYQKMGILRGSVVGNIEDLETAMSRSVPAETAPFSYAIHNPHQQVSHDLYRLKGTYFLANQSFSLQYAYQKNHRAEYSIRRGSNNSIPNINLDLYTQTVDFDWNHPDFGAFTGSAGAQWYYQNGNDIPGTNTIPFVPNYNNARTGVYWIENLTIGNTVYEAGIRYDYQYLSARGRTETNAIFRNTLHYNQVTGSLGVRHQLQREVMFRSNVGLAWRPPNIAELYSYGKTGGYAIEYGLWRYEFNSDGSVSSTTGVLNQSDKEVKSEVGLKWITSVEKATGKTRWEFTPYVNYIAHYIFNTPAGITTTTSGTLPYFIYEQTNALFVGMDAMVRRSLTSHFNAEGQASYVWVKDVSDGDTFVEIPPLKLSGKFSYDKVPAFLSKSSIGVDVSYTFHYFQQPRVITPSQFAEASDAGTDLFASNHSNFDFMTAPKGYWMTNFSWTGGKGNWEWAFVVKNLFNVTYRNNTNRLRYYADEVGRNFRISVSYLIH